MFAAGDDLFRACQVHYYPGPFGIGMLGALEHCYHGRSADEALTKAKRDVDASCYDGNTNCVSIANFKITKFTGFWSWWNESGYQCELKREQGDSLACAYLGP